MDADLSKLSRMKVDELKAFLRLRGLKTNGKKEELVARVFVAIENEVPTVKTAEEVEREIATEYEAKLKAGCKTLPDPFGITSGWVNEEDGTVFWPVTLYPDIYNFLANHPNELTRNDIANCKQSKGYSYYSQGWLSPLSFHPIADDSEFCFLKGTCRPSQRINDTPHKLWICLAKRDGNVVSTHCSCMAGLSQTCNHVVAALFRIEAVSRMGLNNPSCTSKPCQWLPSNKLVKPMKIKDLKLKRSSLGGSTRKKELNCSPKKNFDPLEHVDYRLNLQDMAKSLETVCDRSECILFTALPKPELPSTEVQNVKVIPMETHFLLSANGVDFLNHIKMINVEDINAIEVLTRGQADNQHWHSFRKHVISGSKGHDVKTCMASLRKDDSKRDSLNTIFSKVAGSREINNQLPALKYGRAMESTAIESFKEDFLKHHKNVKITSCGLFLCEDIPFVGGSPDSIVSCDCCGKACIEVKCPFSIQHTTPYDPNVKLPYLKQIDGNLSLNEAHRYYTQCQIQMAATKTECCHFFVWTSYGHFTQKIKFNIEFWVQIKGDFENFYLNYYIPHLFKNRF